MAECCNKKADAGVAEAPRVDFSEFPAATYDQWKEAAIAALKGGSFEKSMFTKTYEGITLEPLYTLEHVKGIGSARSLPGEGSMLRGAEASGYIGRPWEIVQPAREHDPREANKAAVHEVERGATTASFELDERTLAGLDPDSSSCICGVSVSVKDDAKAMFDGVDFDKTPLHIYAGASSAPMLGLIAAEMKRGGYEPSELSGCVGADPIGHMAQTGKSARALDELVSEMASSIKYAGARAPKLRTVLLRGAVPHNAGANAVQEVAFVMTNAIELAARLADRGVSFDEFAKHVRFELSIGANFFMEIAKIRAARVVWSRIAESFGGSDASRVSSIFGRTSFFTKTYYDPYVNMLRNTVESFASVVGGVDGLTVGCFDEAVRSADEFSRRVSRNAQVMLQNEYHFIQPIDPAGGSWYLESLTHALSEKIWAEIQQIEGEGGIVESLKAGKIQARVKEVLDDRFKKLSSRQDRAVGTNMYANMTETPLPQHEIDEAAVRSARADAVSRAKASRSQADADAALKAVAGEHDCLIGAIEAAFEAGATIGEVSAALASGTACESAAPFAVHRWTEQYEELRGRTEKYRQKHGDNVKVFLANMGPIPQHKARADFITGFMEVAAFEVLKNDGFKTPEECAEAAEKSGADIAVICSTDATYPELVPQVARLIKQKCSKMKVCLAGAPAEEHKQSYTDAGVDDFVHVRTNCLSFLTELQREKGMMQ